MFYGNEKLDNLILFLFCFEMSSVCCVPYYHFSPSRGLAVAHAVRHRRCFKSGESSQLLLLLIRGTNMNIRKKNCSLCQISPKKSESPIYDKSHIWQLKTVGELEGVWWQSWQLKSDIFNIVSFFNLHFSLN